jgi:hypothetical protein
MLNLGARITRSTPCERDVRGCLAAFYGWCARNDDIPGLLSPGQDSLPLTLGRPDRLHGPDRRHERGLGEPKPARETGGPAGIWIQEPGQPAQARPHRLHPRHTPEAAHHDKKENTESNQSETTSRLTSKTLLYRSVIRSSRSARTPSDQGKQC